MTEAAALARGCGATAIVAQSEDGAASAASDGVLLDTLVFLVES